MTIAIRILGAADRDVLRQVAPDVFDGPVAPHWSAVFLADARHHLAVAIDDGWVVGMASAVDYVHPDKPPELWINEVGVAPTHRGLGVARRILAALMEHGRTLGCRAAWVLTHESNTAARRLYAAVGGIEEVGDTPVLVNFALTESENAQERATPASGEP
jgi:GNAT superfamily N-acetyltransferase